MNTSSISLRKLAEKFTGAKAATENSYTALCPVHDDNSASLSISSAKDGKLLLHCFVGCSYQDILAQVGLSPKDLFPQNPAPKKKKPSSFFVIKDKQSQVIAEHHRVEIKDGRKRYYWIRNGKKGLQGLKTSALPLYGSEKIPSYDPSLPVFLCEGEKAATALQEIGTQALGTCTGAGATPSAKTLSSLKGFRVILWPDNDPAGKAHMGKLRKALHALHIQTAFFLPAGLEEKEDAFDYVAKKRANSPTLSALCASLLELAQDLFLAQNPKRVVCQTLSAQEKLEVMSSMTLNKEGEPYPCIENIEEVLLKDSRLKGVLAYDEFSGCVVTLQPPPWLARYKESSTFLHGQEWSDYDDTKLASFLSKEYGIRAKLSDIFRTVQVIAKTHKFHPVRTYLRSLRWDHTPRLDTFLTNYFGCEDTRYTRSVSAKFLLASVARVMKPGCICKYVPVLEGPQDAGKSTAIRYLYGDEFFSDDMADLSSKDAPISLVGKWGVEFAELDALTRHEANKIKAFISRTKDRYREPYGTRASDHPRQSIFIGTTNNNDYLKDPTGGVRFWPILCTHIDLRGIKHSRDQLWAEALVRFEAREVWWMEDEEELSFARKEQSKRLQSDAWEEIVTDYMKGKDKLSAYDILFGALGMEAKDQNRLHTTRLKVILSRLGYENKIFKKHGKCVRGYVLSPRLPIPSKVLPISYPKSTSDSNDVTQVTEVTHLSKPYRETAHTPLRKQKRNRYIGVSQKSVTCVTRTQARATEPGIDGLNLGYTSPQTPSNRPRTCVTPSSGERNAKQAQSEKEDAGKTQDIAFLQSRLKGHEFVEEIIKHFVAVRSNHPDVEASELLHEILVQHPEWEGGC